MKATCFIAITRDCSMLHGAKALCRRLAPENSAHSVLESGVYSCLDPGLIVHHKSVGPAARYVYHIEYTQAW